jgi:putative endonuclease
MKAFVYILKGSDGRFYVGSTVDLNRRMIQHENGHTQTTKNMGSVSLVLSQEFPTLDDARRIERKIKRLKRKDYVEKMIADGKITMK